MSSNRVVHALFRGRVHGVGFRAFVHHHAERRGIEGWVRNRRDGTVEAVFAGDAAAVGALLEACREGPPGARVDGLDIKDDDPAAVPEFGSGRFEVRATV